MDDGRRRGAGRQRVRRRDGDERAAQFDRRRRRRRLLGITRPRAGPQDRWKPRARRVLRKRALAESVYVGREGETRADKVPSTAASTDGEADDDDD